MEIHYQIISVFTDLSKGITGNPSAVVWLDQALPDMVMQKMAAQLNQPATTFIWKEQGEYLVRWFAPDEEITLCGHGTAAAGVFLGKKWGSGGPFTLKYKEGEVSVRWLGEKVEITLNAIPVQQEESSVPNAIKEGLGIPIKAMFATANKHLILTDSQDNVKNMRPDFERLRESEIFGYAVTAPGEEVDFVSRTLVPHVGQLEDFATGSSHAVLVPFWAERLGKTTFKALQLSQRGGAFEGELIRDKVILTGQFKVEKTGSWEV